MFYKYTIKRYYRDELDDFAYTNNNNYVMSEIENFKDYARSNFGSQSVIRLIESNGVIEVYGAFRYDEDSDEDYIAKLVIIESRIIE